MARRLLIAVVNRSDAISLILQAASHIGAHASDTNKADM
jgi:hypothetical protein